MLDQFEATLKVGSVTDVLFFCLIPLFYSFSCTFLSLKRDRKFTYIYVESSRYIRIYILYTRINPHVYYCNCVVTLIYSDCY